MKHIAVIYYSAHGNTEHFASVLRRMAVLEEELA
jgi:flavodoxin